MGTSNRNSGVTLRWTSISSATSNSVHKFLSCIIIPLKMSLVNKSINVRIVLVKQYVFSLFTSLLMYRRLILPSIISSFLPLTLKWTNKTVQRNSKLTLTIFKIEILHDGEMGILLRSGIFMKSHKTNKIRHNNFNSRKTNLSIIFFFRLVHRK